MIDIGEPLFLCPKCKKIIIKNNVKEINMMTKFDYFKLYSNSIISILFVCGLCGIILISVILAQIFQLKDSTLITLSVIFDFALIIFGEYKGLQTINNKIDKSKKRLEKDEYKNLIEEIFNLKKED